MKRNVKYFLPSYNEENQVKNCVENMIGKKIAKAEVVITIGFNGTDFSSSTEWLVTAEDGQECILPFKVSPQYTTFVSLVAGMEIKKNNAGQLVISYHEKTIVLITPEGEEHYFETGKPLRIGINKGNQRFIGTDCDVKIHETDDTVIYHIVPDTTTHYASYTDKVMAAD